MKFAYGIYYGKQYGNEAVEIMAEDSTKYNIEFQAKHEVGEWCSSRSPEGYALMTKNRRLATRWVKKSSVEIMDHRELLKMTDESGAVDLDVREKILDKLDKEAWLDACVDYAIRRNLINIS